MDPTSKPKKKVERVSLSPEATGKVDGWFHQLKEAIPSTRVTRTDVANFVICTAPDHLSDPQLKEFESLHFDQVKALKRVLNQVTSGATDKSLELLVQEVLSRGKKPQRRRAPRSSKSVSPSSGQ